MNKETREKDVALEDRDYIKRYYKKDPNEIFVEIKGEPFRKYREAWDAASNRQVRSDVPVQLGVELTSYCNLLCKMCYRNYKMNPLKENMPLELAAKLATQARELKIPAILLGSFTEALLHPQIKEIMRMFAEVNAQEYMLITNGTKLTEDIAEVMVDIPLDRLNVSLDAATPETYREIRGADLNAVTANIMRFVELRNRKGSRLPLLRLSFVELEDNIHEKELFIEQWKDIADVIDFQKHMDTSGIVKAGKVKSTGSFLCTDPFKMVTAKYDGELIPCCHVYYQTNKPAYIQEMSIMEYWNHPDILALVESIKEKRFSASCYKCVNSIAEAGK